MILLLARIRRNLSIQGEWSVGLNDYITEVLGKASKPQSLSVSLVVLVVQFALEGD